MYNPELDGVDHINVYSRSRGEVGRFLSNFAHTPIVLPDDGRFESIEGYWHWLGLEHDAVILRHLYGYKARQVGRQLRAEYGSRPDPCFEQRIRTAVRLKLEDNPAMVAEWSKTRLPLAHYYVYRGTVRDAGHRWFVQLLQEELERAASR